MKSSLLFCAAYILCLDVNGRVNFAIVRYVVSLVFRVSFHIIQIRIHIWATCKFLFNNNSHFHSSIQYPRVIVPSRGVELLRMTNYSFALCGNSNVDLELLCVSLNGTVKRE